MDLDVDLHVAIEMARSHNWNFVYCGNLVFVSIVLLNFCDKIADGCKLRKISLL